MAVRIIKDGQVVQDVKKSPLEIELEGLHAKVALLEIYIKDLQNQIKDLKTQNGKKTYKKTSTR